MKKDHDEDAEVEAALEREVNSTLSPGSPENVKARNELLKVMSEFDLKFAVS